MRSSRRSRTPCRPYGNGLLCLFLALFLTACETIPTGPVVRKVEKSLPPESLLLEASVAEWPASTTNWGLLEHAKVWRRQLLECQAEKAAIKAWGQDP